MVTRSLTIIVAFAATFSFSSVARAGMPSYSISDLAAVRLQGISFFLMGVLVSALAIQWLWNYLAKDFTRLPRLNYPRACGVVVLWGLLFVIVLTMISGARELMTPGAWARQGTTYQLTVTDDATTPTETQFAPPVDDAATQLAQRRLQLADLRSQLERFALKHDGQFPNAIGESDIDDSFWKVPNTSGLTYIYIAGRTTVDRHLPLVIEPPFFTGDPLVLLVGGDIVQLPREHIEQSLAATVQP